VTSNEEPGEGIQLSRIPPGGTVRLRAFTGGRLHRSRLANLGFTLDADLRVVQNYGRGPMLVAVRDTLVALGRAEAERILVVADC
jgi:Fe2+ transport system protein FeoA